jgi:hypothetical protein
LFTLTFDEKVEYADDAQGINLDVIISKQTDNSIAATVKLDTGSTFCIFQRFYAELLGIEVENGTRETIRTAKGSFMAFGHEVSIKFSNLEWDAIVFRAGREFSGQRARSKRFSQQNQHCHHRLRTTSLSESLRQLNLQQICCVTVLLHILSINI